MNKHETKEELELRVMRQMMARSVAKFKSPSGKATERERYKAARNYSELVRAAKESRKRYVETLNTPEQDYDRMSRLADQGLNPYDRKVAKLWLANIKMTSKEREHAEYLLARMRKESAL